MDPQEYELELAKTRAAERQGCFNVLMANIFRVALVGLGAALLVYMIRHDVSPTELIDHIIKVAGALKDWAR